jgi:hypothetical protein
MIILSCIDHGSAQLAQSICEPQLARRWQDEICMANVLRRHERVGDRDAAHPRCMRSGHSVGGVLNG